MDFRLESGFLVEDLFDQWSTETKSTSTRQVANLKVISLLLFVGNCHHVVAKEGAVEGYYPWRQWVSNSISGL